MQQVTLDEASQHCLMILMHLWKSLRSILNEAIN
jgi:hypothetical protein